MRSGWTLSQQDAGPDCIWPDIAGLFLFSMSPRASYAPSSTSTVLGETLEEELVQLLIPLKEATVLMEPTQTGWHQHQPTPRTQNQNSDRRSGRGTAAKPAINLLSWNRARIEATPYPAMLSAGQLYYP